MDFRKKPSYHKYNRERKPRVTYLLGARCKDGVVIIGDRKFTVDYGEHYVYGDKLSGDLSNSFVIGFSGDRGVFELFKTTFDDALNEYYRTSDKMPIERLILLTSDTIAKINNKFRGCGEPFDAMLGVSTGRKDASLKYFYPDGRLVSVDTIKAIGSGSPYGSIFLRTWNSGMTMEQTAEMAYFIIKYIEQFELTHSVGVGNGHPEIWFLPDPAYKDIRSRLTPDYLELYNQRVETKICQFKSFLETLFPIENEPNHSSKKRQPESDF